MKQWMPVASHPHAIPLEEGGRGAGGRAGEPGMAYFDVRTRGQEDFRVYPACSRHGAMNRVGGGDRSIWRCLVEACNVGLELAAGPRA